MQGLIDKLKADPSLKVVYFDEKGEWSLMVSNRHPIEKTRDEVLDMEEIVEDEEDEEDELENALLEIKVLQQQVGTLEEENAAVQKTAATQKAEYEKVIAALKSENEKLKKTPAKPAAAATPATEVKTTEQNANA